MSFYGTQQTNSVGSALPTSTTSTWPTAPIANPFFAARNPTLRNEAARCYAQYIHSQNFQTNSKGALFELTQCALGTDPQLLQICTNHLVRVGFKESDWAARIKVANTALSVGAKFLTLRDFFTAEAVLRTAIWLNPWVAGSNLGLAIVLINLGRLDEALSAVTRSIDLDPMNGFACQLKEQILRTSIKINPRNAVVCEYLGDFLQWQGRFSEAREMFIDALVLTSGISDSCPVIADALCPENAHICLKIADTFCQESQFDYAKCCLVGTMKACCIHSGLEVSHPTVQKVIEKLRYILNSTCSTELLDIEFLKEQGRFQEAGDLILKAILLDPKNAERYERYCTIIEIPDIQDEKRVVW